VTAFIGDPALRRLGLLELRGFFRRRLRRLRTPSGALFALAGIALVVVWLGSLGLALSFGGMRGVAPDEARAVARLAVFGLFLLGLMGNLSHRGLYLPAHKIERLFSAPVARADLIRYRLHCLLAQSAIGAFLVGLALASRMPSVLSVWLAAPLLVATVAIAGQGAALLLGAFEHRLPLKWLPVVSRVGMIALLIAGALFYQLLEDVEGERSRLLLTIAEDPRVLAISGWCEPWARLMTATDADQRLWATLLCAAIALVAFEAVARIPVDFRELALANAADVARRLRRLRRGGVAGAAKVSRAASVRRVPWVAGRGVRGAIVWLKLGGIVRRAPVTLAFSAFMLAVLVISAGAFSRGEEPEMRVVGSWLIAGLGTLYLASGLRFDFREEAERLERIKSWPLAAHQTFLAVLLPQASLVVLLLALGTSVHATWIGVPVADLWPVFATLPLLVWIWLALDNALFLVWPVRVAPGQDGALQNMGRAGLLMVVRMALVTALGALAGGVGWGVRSGLGEAAGWAASASVLAIAGWGLLRAGGAALARFDPSSLER
jgi:hypothetical protein